MKTSLILLFFILAPAKVVSPEANHKDRDVEIAELKQELEYLELDLQFKMRSELLIKCQIDEVKRKLSLLWGSQVR